MEKNFGNVQSLLKGKLTKNKIIAILFLWVLAMSTLYIETRLGIEGTTATMRELQTILDQMEVEINSTWYALQKPVDYLIVDVTSGGTTYTTMQNGTTGRLQAYSTNTIDVLQWAHDNLSSTTGGVIQIAPDIDASGTNDVLTITKSWVTITSDGFRGTLNEGLPMIRKIKLDSNGVSMRGIYIKGIQMRELELYGNDQAIHHVMFESCGFYPDSGIDSGTNAKGIRITNEDDSAHAEFVDWIWFINCKIRDDYDQSVGSRWMGAISYEQTDVSANVVGTGQFWFENLDYRPMVNNATLLCVDGNRGFHQAVYFDELNVASGEGKTGVKLFRLKDGQLEGLFVHDSYFELKGDEIILAFDAGAKTNQQFWANFHDNDFVLGSSGSYTVTFIDNQKTYSNWNNNPQMSIIGDDNRVMTNGNGDEFVLGTTGENERFVFDCDIIYYRGDTITKYFGKAPFEDYSYLIAQTNTYFYMRNGTTGRVDAQSTSLSTIFNWCEGNLSSGGRIAFKPDSYTSDGVFTVDTSNIIVDFCGSIITLANSVNDHMVEVTGTGTVNVYIGNGKLDGNNDQQTSGCGIYIDTPYSDTYGDTHHVIDNMRIVDIEDHGIYTGESGADTRVVMMSNIYMGGTSNGDTINGNGFHLRGTDHHLVNCEVGFTGLSGFWVKATNSKFVNCKAFASGLLGTANDRAGFTFVGTDVGCYNTVTNCEAQENRYEGLYLYNGARDNVFINFRAEKNGVATPSPAIYLNNGAVRNTFEGGSVWEISASGHTDCIRLNDDCDDNNFIGMFLYNPTSDGIQITTGDHNQIKVCTINDAGAWAVNIISGTNNTMIGNTYLDNVSGGVTGGTGTINQCYVDDTGYHA